MKRSEAEKVRGKKRRLEDEKLRRSEDEKAKR